ncbi:MAG: hypothetical protein WEB04_07795 [Dehalococcoidia bacterium]
MRIHILAVAVAAVALAFAFSLSASNVTQASDVIPGNVNCNARTDAIDASLILQLDAHLVSSLPCQTAGDINSDGAANAIDGSFILQTVAGLIPSFGAVISIDIETAQPIGVGQQFVAEIHVDNAPRLSAYEFRLVFDDADVSFVGMGDLGDMFADSQRNPICTAEPGAFHWNCFSAGPPVCLGGGLGPSGSGTLGRAVFRAEQAGVTSVDLADTELVWDDIIPCDPVDFRVYPIPHKQRNATLTIE